MRALKVAVVLLAIGIVGFVGMSAVRAWQAYHSVGRETFAEAVTVRSRIATITPEQRAELRAEEKAAELAEQERREEAAAQAERDLYAAIAASRAEIDVPDERFELPTAHSPGLPDSMFASYLLIGQEGYRADSMIYVLLPSDGSAPIMVSLPRDLYVLNPCTDQYARLNTGLGGCKGFAGGAELLSLMVEDFTGIEVDHLARIDFGGFEQVIDALGGVDICVDDPVRDEKSKLDLPAGCSHVGGKQALAWVRSRHTEVYVDGEWKPMPGASDFARQRRQQDMLFKIAGRLASFGSFGAFSDVANQLAGVIRLDSRFSFGDAVNLAWKFRGITSSQVRRFRIPVDNYVTPGGAWVLLPTKTFNESLAKVYPAAKR